MEISQLVCTNLTDADLPLSDFNGQTFAVVIVSKSGNLTTMPSSSFGTAKAQTFEIVGNPNLRTLEDNFLGTGEGQTTEIIISDCPMIT